MDFDFVAVKTRPENLQSVAVASTSIPVEPSYNFTYRLHLKLSRLLRPLTLRLRRFNDKPRFKRLGYGAMALLVFGSSFYWLSMYNPKRVGAASQGPNSAAASGDCTNDATVGTVSWGATVGNAFSNNATYASASVDGTVTNYILCTNFGFTLPTTGTTTIDGIIVAVERKSDSTGNGGSADSSVRIVKGGTIGSTNRATATTYTTSDVSENHGSTTDLWGETWTVSDINASNFGTAFAATKANAAGAAHSITVDHITITVHYTHIPALPQLTLKGYIWENDDATGDGATQLAAGSTSITMRRGERATLRAQLRNTGGPLNSTDKLGLFYDRNDGMWVKAKDFIKPVTGGSGCTSSSWTCTSVESANVVGNYTSIAISPLGVPYASYYDSTNLDLRVAQYVGSGGSGCASSAWTCTAVDTNLGTYTSIAFSPAGVPYISHSGSGGLNIATYVGTGGDCTSTAWDCTGIINSGTIAATSLAFNSAGVPYIAYYDQTNGDLEIAVYVGSGGSGCFSSAWTCTVIDSTNVVGDKASLAFSPGGVPYISYFDDTNDDIRIAQYVGSGGSGCASSAWTCTTVDTSDGQNSSLAFSPSGTPYISWGSSLRVAQYVGSGGSGCSSSAWTCTAIESAVTQTSIAFSPGGIPHISFYNQNGSALEVAHYVGSSGTGCTSSSAWTCTVVDETVSVVGEHSSLAFSHNGTPYISYQDSTNTALKIAYLNRQGEITATPSYGGAASLTESHADMTAYDNTANRDDADCITSGTWNNGKYFLGEDGSGLSIADGQSTAQCTEVAWTIDTSQALSNTTYRFVIATDDAIAQWKGKWRGPIGIDAYPTLMIEDDSKHTTTQVYGKSTLLANNGCTGGLVPCDMVHTTNFAGWASSIAFDTSGSAWISYYDSSLGAVHVARYVGSGGNCDTTWSGSDAWECMTIDNNTTTVTTTSIAIDSSGIPWVAYSFSSGSAQGLFGAYYVGSGGDCDTQLNGSDAWECFTIDPIVDPGDNYGQWVSLAFDKNGTPWVSYSSMAVGDSFNLRVAYFDGTNWNATDVDVTNAVGTYSSLAFDANGIPWVSYKDDTNGDLKIARYVGIGGNCDSSGGSDAWQCTVVDAGTNIGTSTSIAVDKDNVVWVSYIDTGNQDVKVAFYDGDGTSSGCSDNAWTCTAVSVYSGTTSPTDTSIAISPNGTPSIAYSIYDSFVGFGSGYYVNYMGSGGNCSGSAAWGCTLVDGEGGDEYTQDPSLAFDRSGIPWISSYDNGNGNLEVNVMSAAAGSQKPLFSTVNLDNGRNANRTYGRFILNSGRATTSGACTGAADLLGLCGITTEDGQYDSIVAAAKERPVYLMKARFDNNASLPTVTWAGTTSLAPNTAGVTGDLVLQVYRYGSTNAWENVNTNSTSSDCSAGCVISGLPSGTASEYFETDGSNYNVYFRIYQVQSSSSAITFKVDSLKAIQQNQQMRHGRTFNRSLIQPFITEQR